MMISLPGHGSALLSAAFLESPLQTNPRVSKKRSQQQVTKLSPMRCQSLEEKHPDSLVAADRKNIAFCSSRRRQRPLRDETVEEHRSITFGPS